MIVILAVALIVVGPDKLPELARSLAKGVNELKNTMNQVKESLSEESEAISSVQEDLRKTAGQMKNNLIEDVTSNPVNQHSQELQDTNDEAESKESNKVIELESLKKRPWEEDAAAEPKKEAAMTNWRSENEEEEEGIAMDDQQLDTVADQISNDANESKNDCKSEHSSTSTSPTA